MRLKLQPANLEDAEAVAALRNAVSDDLTFRHGRGGWTQHTTTAGVILDLRNARLYVALHHDEVVATLVLSNHQPGAIDLKHFPAARRPCYLAAMAIAPEFQRQGLGRACLDAALKIARRTKADAIFLYTHDHPAAGAGPFFGRCGFRECGRVTYRSAPLVYYQLGL